jgi:hypothetical protein
MAMQNKNKHLAHSNRNTHEQIPIHTKLLSCTVNCYGILWFL